jgi:hypothetical protein
MELMSCLSCDEKYLHESGVLLCGKCKEQTMKLLVGTSIYLESGETLQKVIEITSEDLKRLAEEKAKDAYQCLSASAKKIDLLPYSEEF